MAVHLNLKGNTMYLLFAPSALAVIVILAVTLRNSFSSSTNV
jgi:hypothetical protein